MMIQLVAELPLDGPPEVGVSANGHGTGLPVDTAPVTPSRESLAEISEGEGISQGEPETFESPEAAGFEQVAPRTGGAAPAPAARQARRTQTVSLPVVSRIVRHVQAGFCIEFVFHDSKQQRALRDLLFKIQEMEADQCKPGN
jgi:hypothetical protein